MKRVIIRDIVGGVALAVLIYLSRGLIKEYTGSVILVVLLAVVLVVWLYRKSYGQAVGGLIEMARLLQVPVIISFLGLGYGLYVNRYNTEPLVFVMLLASLGSVGLCYKLLLDWTGEMKSKTRVCIKKHRLTIFGIVLLWLVAEGVLVLIGR